MQDASVPAPPEAPGRARPPRRIPTWAVVVVAGVIASLLLGAAVVQLPYYALEPGLVRPTNDLIAVDGTETFRPRGSIAYTTVRLKQMTLFDMVGGWLDPDVAVYPRDALLGGRSEDDNRSINRELMDDSKQVATEVALRQLGYPVGVEASGFIILGIRPGFDATRDALEPGDVIVGVDGEVIDERDDLSRLVEAHVPGEAVTLRVEPRAGGDSVDIPLQLSADPSDPDRPVIGVEVQARDLSFDFPFDVTIDSGTVGGNSAGLAFTLGLIDLLTPGELTGGKAVAVTGTIQQDGTVGLVGGVAQKVAAAREADVDVFLVPSAEYDDAAEHAGDDIEILRVDTLEQALAALARLGGNGLALGKPGEAVAS